MNQPRMKRTKLVKKEKKTMKKKAKKEKAKKKTKKKLLVGPAQASTQ